MVKKKEHKNPYNLGRLFTLRQRWGFGITVLVLTLLSVWVILYRNHQLNRRIQTLLDQKQTFTPREYQNLLNTPTIHDYFFPYGVRSFGSTLKPVRDMQGVWGIKEKNEMWLDISILRIEDLPQQSWISLNNHLEVLRATHTNF